MPRTEKIMHFCKDEIQSMLQRKFNIKIKNMDLCADGIMAELVTDEND